MSRQIEYKIKVDSGNSVKTLGQLEEELSKINQELKEVEVGSDRFSELTKSAQQTNAQLKQINKEIEGITIEDKIKGIDGSMKLLAGSTQTVVGGLGLLGVESEKFGEFEEKAASAIALGQGFKQLGDGIKDVSQLIVKLPGPTKIATIAQKAFNTALRANPIGLVVTAIGLVVAGFVLFNDKIKGVIKSIEPLNNILQKTIGFFKSVGQVIGLVASEEELLAKKTKELTNQRIKDLDNEIKVRKAAGEETVELEREKLQKLIELTKEGSQEQKDAIANLRAFENSISKQIKDELAKIEEEKTQKAKQEQEKRRQELENDLIKSQELIKKYNEEEKDLLAVFDEERLAIQLERQFQEIDALKISEDEKNRIKEEALQNYNIRLNQLQEQQAETEKQNAEKTAQDLLAIASQKRADELAFLFADFNLRKQLNAITFEDELNLFNKQRELQREELLANKASNEALLAFDKETAAARLQIEVAQQEAKLGIVSNALGTVASAVGEATAAGKALSIAQATIDTYAGANKALATYPPPFGQIAAGTVILAGLLNVRKILTTKIPGTPNTAGGGISAPSVPSSNISAPSTPTTQTPTIEQLAAAQQVSQNGQEQVIQAYVLEGNVSSAQEASRKIRQRRTIGR